MTPDDQHELLSVTQVAERLGITRQAVLKRLRKGTMRGVKVGNTWTIRADELED